MRYAPEHKGQTRQRVLQEASKVVLEGGARRLSVGGVMARASLTHGGFYSHFSSKQELVKETVDLMVDDVVSRYKRVTQGLAARDALRAYIEFYLSPRHRDNTDSICPLPAITAEVASLGSEPQKSYERGLDSLISSLAEHIWQIGLGDSEAVATSVAAELVGAMSLARAVADEAKSDQILERSTRCVLARLGIKSSKSSEKVTMGS